MTRVMVIGNAGGGKTTLCRAICEAHTLPYFAIDKIQWKPGWVRMPEDEFQIRHAAMLAGDRWLIDGFGSIPLVEERLDACDTVIFVDHPIPVHLLVGNQKAIQVIVFRPPRRTGWLSDVEGYISSLSHDVVVAPGHSAEIDRNNL